MAAQARLLTAEAYTGDDTDPVTAELAERAITLARRAGDPLAESAALDELTAVQLARGELRGALASALRRIEILGPLPVTARSGLEHSDASSWPPSAPPPLATCGPPGGWPNGSGTCRSTARRATWPRRG